jgi:hypothetical protein
MGAFGVVFWNTRASAASALLSLSLSGRPQLICGSENSKLELVKFGLQSGLCFLCSLLGELLLRLRLVIQYECNE